MKEIKDIKGHWAEESIKLTMAMGLMNGNGDGTFSPDNPLTRAEFCQIQVNKLKKELSIYLDDFLLALDIGHGNDTSGKGVKGFSEHWFNSEVVLKVMKMLEALGIRYYLPQPPHAPEVKGRARRDEANNERHPSLYYSVHGNASVKPSVTGSCCFYWGQKELALQHIKHLKTHGFDLHGNGLHEYKNNTWTDLWVIEDVKGPSMLCEFGFFTNPQELEKMKTSQYQDKVAMVIVQDIIWFVLNKHK